MFNAECAKLSCIDPHQANARLSLYFTAQTLFQMTSQCCAASRSINPAIQNCLCVNLCIRPGILDNFTGGGGNIDALLSSVLFFPMDRRGFHVKQKLSQYLGRSWSVEEMAEEVGMSASHFQHLFKEEIGITPKAYLQSLRLEKARELLADSNRFLLIKEIALQVGLLNASHFTSAFKAKFGVSPSKFRDQHAKIHQSNPQDGQK